MFPQPQPGSTLTIILEVFLQFLDEGFAPWRGRGLSGACLSGSVLQPQGLDTVGPP